MTAAEVQELINEVPCDLCNSPPGLQWYLVLAALVDVANGDPVPTTTQGLVDEANCLLCLVPPGLVPYLMVQAIRGISAGGGGTGGAGIVGTGSPEGVVTAEPGTLYADDTTPGAAGVWIKMSGSGNTGWENVIA